MCEWTLYIEKLFRVKYGHRNDDDDDEDDYDVDDVDDDDDNDAMGKKILYDFTIEMQWIYGWR